MDRKDFVKSLIALTGTAFTYGCKDSFDIDGDIPRKSLSIKESKDWFENQYLPKYKGDAARKKSASIQRILDWNKGSKVKGQKEDFVWAPANYASENQLPTLVTWREGEEYIPQLAEFLKWSISEGFIVYTNKNGETEGALMQIAYDPFIHEPGTNIDIAKFTGMIIHCSWDEQPIRIWRFLEGQLETYYDAERQRSAKVSTFCQNVYYSYQTVTGFSCGPNCHEVVYTLHREVFVYCSDGNNGSGYTGGGAPTGGGGYFPGVTPTPPTNSVYSPFANYDMVKVAEQQTPDFQLFMERLNKTLTTINISSFSLGTSATYASNFIKTLGVQDAYFVKTSTILESASTRIGIVGASVGAIQFAIAVSDTGFDFNSMTPSQKWNLAGVVLGGVALAPIGWWAFAISGVSAAVGFYATALEQQEHHP